ncbi:hypothetical protein [[Mycobacterium] holstebronense]|uniref:Peptidase M41 domain-containing protein n=1 Tax=[Mycobacterium] holstebronense TaxID=3064288 RepID=A0ABM9LT09_9MYCO|nr:hypothetical protein [Mycolicibacter sp. MU0102]CAJ1504250.1 hypothetical protein MU0102_002197 [Mycolicibacter sp. MU0102]
MTYRPPLQFSDADFQRCYASVHEAGHAVAAVLLGGTVHLATVDGQPRTEYDVLPDGARAAVAYAGPWAEARFKARGRPGFADVERELRANPSDDKTLCAAGGPAATGGVTTLLERHLSAVKAVTTALFIDGTIGHAAVCTALGLSDGGGPGSFELANMRAGLRGAPTAT